MEVKQGSPLSSHFSSHTGHKCPFRGLFSAMLCVVGNLVGDFVVLNGHVTFLLVTRLTEKMCVLDKHHSGPSYGTVGCELNLNESTVYIKQGVLKQKHT